MVLAPVLIALASAPSPVWEPLPLRSEAERRAGRSGGESGARIQAIAISPDGRRVLAGTEGSGIWRSEDGGETWRLARRGLAAPDIKALRFDPCAPDIAFAAAAALDPLGAHYGRGEGIYRSADGGRSWSLVRRTDFGPGSFCGRIAFDPRTSPGAAEPCATILVSTMREGILRSEDGGTTWSRLPLSAGDSFSLAAASVADGLRLFAGTSGGLLTSSDGGKRFHRIGQELPVFDLEAPLGPNVAACAASPETIHLYAACREYGIFRSIDGGASWTPANGGGDARLPLGADQDWVSVAVSPADPLVAFANPMRACRGVDRSPFWTHDGGATWHAPESIDDSMLLSPQAGGIGEAVEPDPKDRTRILAGIGGRIFLSVDGGRTWQDRNDGIRCVGPTSLAAITFDAKAAGTFRIGLGALGRVETTDGGETFRPIPEEAISADHGRSPNGGRTESSVDRAVRAVGADPKTIYGEVRDRTGWALEISRDGGATWSRLGPLLDDPIACVVPDPRRADRAYVGTDRGLVVIDGDAATRIGEAEGMPPGPEGAPAVRALAVDAGAPAIVYAGRSSAAGLADGIYASQDGGRTWRRLGDGIEPAINVFAIAVDPHDGTAYASTDCGIWRLRGGLRGSLEGRKP